VTGRRGLALGSILVGFGLVVGIGVGRSTKHTEEAAQEPSLASSRFAGELTDTTPVAAVPVPEPEPASMAAPPPPPAAAPTAPIVTAAPKPAPVAAAAPDAPAPPVAEPEPPAPPATPEAVVAEPPPPDPNLVRQGRAFDNNEITSSSFDDEDVSEYSVVPDHEVTRSSFDDADRANEHPTGQ
jgi:hypothetical protein